MKKGSILSDSSVFSPVQCYSRKDLEILFQCSEVSVRNWIDAGLIKGILTGNRLVFPEFEVRRFQEEMLGKDISNMERVINVKRSRA